MIWITSFPVDLGTVGDGAGVERLGGALDPLSFSLSVSRTWVGFPRRKRGWLASSSVGGALGAAAGASAAGALGAGAGGLTSGGLLSAFGGGCDPGRLSTGGPSSSSRGLGSAL